MSAETIIASYEVSEWSQRAPMRELASGEAERLFRETGVPHKYRWDKETQSYLVIKPAFAPPTRPWDMDENRPDRLPVIGNPEARYVAPEDLLVAAASLSITHWVTARQSVRNGNAFRKDLQIALDAQYGPGYFWAFNHGDRVSVQCRHPYYDDSADPYLLGISCEGACGHPKCPKCEGKTS